MVRRRSTVRFRNGVPSSARFFEIKSAGMRSGMCPSCAPRFSSGTVIMVMSWRSGVRTAICERFRSRESIRSSGPPCLPRSMSALAAAWCLQLLRSGEADRPDAATGADDHGTAPLPQRPHGTHGTLRISLSFTNGTAISHRGLAAGGSRARRAAPATSRWRDAGDQRAASLPGAALARVVTGALVAAATSRSTWRVSSSSGPVTLPSACSRSVPARRTRPWPPGEGWPATSRRAPRSAAVPGSRAGVLGGNGPLTSTAMSSSRPWKRSATSANPS